MADEQGPVKKSLSTIGIAPRLLTREQAAAYCQVSTEIFIARCPVRPVKMGETVRSHRWDIKELDRWLDSLSGEAPTIASNGQQWIDRLGGTNEGGRARRETV
jgi:hypothetical protein